MRIQSPVTDTSTASTARATSTGCLFVSKKYKTYTDTVKILPSHRTQPLSVAFWLEPAISDFRGAFIVSRTVGVPMVSTLYGSRHQNYYTTLKTLGI